jgi:hypothetical protein
MLTQAELRQILRYEPETGFFYRIKPTRGAKKDVMVGSYKKPKSYVRIGVNGKNYLAHSLVWLWTYGYFPKDDIDHINGNKHDNRLENLRIVSRSENNQNRRFANKNNKLGLKGICQIYNGKYRVLIGLNGKNIHLGYFKNLEEAIQARKQGELLHHPCSPVNYGDIAPNC